MMNNPFRVRWLKGWTFQIVLMEGDVKIEASGFGVCLRSSLYQGETPVSAADRLVLMEDKRRKLLHGFWKRNTHKDRLIKSTYLVEESSIKANSDSVVVVA